MKKIIKLILFSTLLVAIGYYLFKSVRYSRMEKKLYEKLDEFKQNENYGLALKSFNDTLPALLKRYTFENSEKDSYSNRPLLSTGPVLFNETFDKCAAFFSLGMDGIKNEKRIQEFYCYGDRVNGKWVFYHLLFGMHGMKMNDGAVDKELKQAFRQLIDDFGIITPDLKYNDHFINCHNKGVGDPRPKK